MSLREYKAKRNFRATREPSGTAKARCEENFFVVQKHDATRLHYDFRLAMEGVLKSWAVPKGFPNMKGDRRLAVRVEDHPMGYAQFEGTIPEGNYGAGTVMVWDAGSYSVGGGDPVRALSQGKLHLTLRGEKLKGEWTLVRMKSRSSGDKQQWLLLKSGDDAPAVPARAENQSVLTRRSLRQIAADNDAQWQSNRLDQRAKASLPRPSKLPRSRTHSRPSPAKVPERNTLSNLGRLPPQKPGFIEPMKAVLSNKLPSGPDWIFELKFDGVRGIAVKNGRGTRLLSRNNKDLTQKYPELVQALDELPSRDAVLDGEIVALDQNGRPSFQLLQTAALPGGQRPRLHYYVFDVLELAGKDLRRLPLSRRKEIVSELLNGLADPIRFSGNIPADSQRVLKEMQARGLEGVMAKRADSKYESGRRSGAWIKFKWTREQEFVIGGYTPPQGARTHFGAILVGYFSGGKLLFASKVGTGFNEGLLKSLFHSFKKLKTPHCPFANLPEPRSARGIGGLGPAEMRRCTWIRPELVCQIRFAEWTRDGHLRQPAFVALREDKLPGEVVREEPVEGKVPS